MIEKITDFGSLSGVLSPLLPLVYADGSFSHNELDGSFFQKNEQGELQAIFSLKNTCVTLILLNENGINELEAFFSFCGVSEILSDKPVEQLCKNQQALNLLEFSGEAFGEEYCLKLTSESSISEYQSVYNILSEQGNNFENWFPEFSKKINSSDAFATYFVVDKKVVSVAISPAIYWDCAIIAGVYTLSTYRNQGFAGKCMKALLSELKINNLSKIYLWCEDKNISFYEKLRFENIGKIYLGACN